MDDSEQFWKDRMTIARAFIANCPDDLSLPPARHVAWDAINLMEFNTISQRGRRGMCRHYPTLRDGLIKARAALTRDKNLRYVRLIVCTAMDGVKIIQVGIRGGWKVLWTLMRDIKYD